jgi:hypothetical protein
MIHNVSFLAACQMLLAGTFSFPEKPKITILSMAKQNSSLLAK